MKKDTTEIILARKEQAYLKSVADAVTRQAFEANGEYGIPVDPDVAEFMGLDISEDIRGHEDD